MKKSLSDESVVRNTQEEADQGPRVQGQSEFAHGVMGSTRSSSAVGVYGNGPKNAGWFEGGVTVRGNFSVVNGQKNFKIDHPVDPENKYLLHSAVESSEMKNVYDGVVQLDEDGAASVDLPDWFEALNGDFRYQLTAVGGAAPNLHVAEELNENRFKIAGEGGDEGMLADNGGSQGPVGRSESVRGGAREARGRTRTLPATQSSRCT